MSMNEYYSALYVPITKEWLLANHNLVESNDHTLIITNQELTGKITFYGENIMELSITDSTTNDIVYYLHFEMKDFKFITENLKAFFKTMNKQKAKNDFQIANGTSIHRIMICCSSGLTSSLFADSLQNIFDQEHLGIQVDAFGAMEVNEELANSYDLILLAPQIGYQLAEFKNRFGNKVYKLNNLDYGTMDFQNIAQKILCH